MFEVSVKGDFSAAHFLRDYHGKCEKLHGHNWKVEVCVSGRTLDKCGMVIDFKELKDKLNRILCEFDHSFLNEISYFKKINPTSENIAEYIYKKLDKQISNKNLKVKKVSVWESEKSYATFLP
ncbi:MAG: 6-carboxytetrahydropterin synthase QueD [Candidatus Omnitrophica bacterium]|nr:6-carboxytetrahydropterin synthase QueD [Candidatus Omnitrophota bacterium]